MIIFVTFFCVEAHWWVGAEVNLSRSEEAAKREGIFYRKRRLLGLVFGVPNSEHLDYTVREQEQSRCRVYDNTRERIAFLSVVRLKKVCGVFVLVYSYGVGFYVLARSTVWASSEAWNVGRVGENSHA